MSLFDKILDKSIPIPLYFQLKGLILDSIKDGTFSVGESIPTENELAAYFQISRATVRQAISELSQEGWLIRKASKGTFVTVPEQNSNYIRSFEPFYQQVSRQNKLPSTELLNLEIIQPTKEIAKKLNLADGDKVISMFRRRFSDTTPMVTIQNYIPYSLCSYILSQDFTTKSLYELLMGHAETKIKETKTVVSASLATSEDVRLLEVKTSTPMLCFHNVSTSSDGTVIDYAFARYRGDLNKFEFIDSPRN